MGATCSKAPAGEGHSPGQGQDMPAIPCGAAAAAMIISPSAALCPAITASDAIVPGAPLPEEEEQRRLQALLACRVLDTPDEHRFDAITRLLASVFKVPISVVGLIDANRLWLKSIQGVESREGQRLHSFCDASLRLPCPTMMVVPDTLADVRFQQNQFERRPGRVGRAVVSPPYVRFYAGAPLVSSEGCVLGSLAVMDIKPRTIPAEIANLMTNFAELVVRELEKEKVEHLRRRQAEGHARLVRKLSAFDEAVLLCDVRAKGWPIRFVNSQWCGATGTSEAAALCSGFWGLFHFASQADTAQLLYAYAAIEERKPFALNVAPGPAPSASPGGPTSDADASNGIAHAVVLEFRPATADHISLDCPHIGIPNFVSIGLQELGPGEECVELPDGLYFAVMKERLPEVLQPALAEPAAPLSNGVAAQQAAVQAPATALRRAPPLPMPQLKLSVQPLLPVPRLSEPHTPLADEEAPIPQRESAASCMDNAGRSSVGAPSPRSPGRELRRSVSTPWAPRPYGQETPEELSAITVGPLLGRGAHGAVYRGLWQAQGDMRKVAVKIIDCFVEADPLTMQPKNNPQPVLEAMLSQNLGQHPNIVQTLKFAVRSSEADELAPGNRLHQSVWIVEELCDRGTLYDAVDRGWLRASPAADAPPNIRAILLTAQDIAAAMAFLHSHNVLHADLAGGNVLLTAAPDDVRGFRAKVSDFGVSRILMSIQCETATLGTISHMPPEMLFEGLLSKATDVYSFGCLCWELYTGMHAWGGRRVAQIVHAKTILHQSLELPPHCPAGFRALVDSCLDSDHSRRPSFDAILAVLRRLVKGVSPGPVPGAEG